MHPKTTATVGSLGAGPLIVWLWNMYNPEMAMPAEVAAIFSTVIAKVVNYLVAWLPTPPQSA